MNPRFGKRTWVKLWVNEWLDGTTRFEMTDSQRAFWIDLLAMAGRSRTPGIICAGQVNGSFVGYPITKFQSLLSEPMDVEATFCLFERTGKIQIEITQEIPIRLYKLTLINWDKYQSEYQRQKKYRKGLQRSDRQSYTQGNKTEGEGEGEGDTEGEKKQYGAAASAAAFSSLNFAPFGPKRFRAIWTEEFAGVEKTGEFTDAMERTAQRCQHEKVKVPAQFFTLKRQVEKMEIDARFRKRPL